jgi:hypothetical protein
MILDSKATLIERCQFAEWLYSRSGVRFNSPEGQRAWHFFRKGVLVKVEGSKAPSVTPPKP